MGRPKKIQNIMDDDDEVAEAVETIEADKSLTNNVVPTGIDLAALVKSVQGRYAKKPALAQDIRTGNEVLLSTDRSDYVVSDEVAFWRPLTGILGLPFGRVVQIAGKPDSGKSTTAMTFMKAAQRDGVLVLLWDSEGKFSARRYKDSIGGEPSTILLSPNKNIIEGAQEMIFMVKAAKKQNPDVKILLVWDSVGATLNTAEDDENDEYSKQPGVTAKQVSWAIRRFNQLIEKYRDLETGKHTMSVLCINQVYANIGSVGFKQKGGAELEYLSSIILELTRKKSLTRVKAGQKQRYGIISRANVVKNHLFDGTECIAELDLAVSADGITLADTVKDQSDIVEED
jgi:RecA/RadA recombinase